MMRKKVQENLNLRIIPLYVIFHIDLTIQDLILALV